MPAYPVWGWGTDPKQASRTQTYKFRCKYTLFLFWVFSCLKERWVVSSCSSYEVQQGQGKFRFHIICPPGLLLAIYLILLYLNYWSQSSYQIYWYYFWTCWNKLSALNLERKIRWKMDAFPACISSFYYSWHRTIFKLEEWHKKWLGHLLCFSLYLWELIMQCLLRLLIVATWMSFNAMLRLKQFS